MHFQKKPDWHIGEAEATPEEIFLNRRQILMAMGIGAAGSLSGGLLLPSLSRAAQEDPSASLYPVPRNEAYELDRELTPEEVNLRYNNFYEFGSHKEIHKAAQALKTRPWEVRIDGAVEEEKTVAIDDLLKAMPLEERLYRHRCVEAWSMTIPWSGFAMKALLDYSQPTSKAKYVRFETFHDKEMASGQSQFWYPWPYVEGMTMEEAANDLAFMVTGAYGKPLAKQFGAPLRLALPWKYGFKSIKSIRRITFTAERPVSFWEQLAPTEYGFWANVNPDVPHPRWSQATERVLHTGDRVPTLIYNGYGEQVAGLYDEIGKSEKIFY
ncbi:protein-methionine-sulfoxide reductase catalytic subunit MsrP [Salaquimonas pukyongi]|uniref:protein-methionine-sulfoxide reductase catalytic subunit MsrP n=1 Tax=Salaquimonas pukyongi TaxID=2712698 RepID=UPI00096BC524|nr:protein-methionine-sulfoxide reductase catalytic subunit MsrP [Salaquimonas pukyongi]